MSLVVLCSLAAAGCAEAWGEADPVGEAAQALPTDGMECVEIQRGGAGDVADATIWQLGWDWNDGASEALWTGTSGEGGPRRTLLRFDLSGLPADASVQSAALTLMQLFKDDVSAITAHRITAAWAEDSVTWDSFGGAYDPAPAAVLVAEPEAAPRTADLTALVRDWQHGAAPNHGVLLREPPVLRTSFRSSESQYAEERPRLSVCYTTCSDGLQNGAETGLDCGGPDCAPCDDLPPATGELAWSHVYGAQGSPDLPAGVAADGAGNIVLAGSSFEPLDFGAGPVSGNGNGMSGFVTRLGPDGQALWSRSVAGTGSTFVRAVAVDPAGAAVITGVFSGALTIGATTLVSAGGDDMFVAKLDPLGDLVWARRFGGSAGYSDGWFSRIAVDAAGNIVLAGGLIGDVDFGGGVRACAGQLDALLVKLDPDGQHVFSVRYGGAGHDHFDDVAVDASGSILVVGEGEVNLGGELLDGHFLARFDAAGAPVASEERSHSGRVAVDAAGNIFVPRTVTLPAPPQPPGWVGFWPSFVNEPRLTKLSPAFAPLWTETLFNNGGFTNGYVEDLAVDPSGQAVVLIDVVSPEDYSLIFPSRLVKVGAAGGARWSHPGAPLRSDTFNTPSSVACDGAGNVIVTGSVMVDDMDYGTLEDIYLEKRTP